MNPSGFWSKLGLSFMTALMLSLYSLSAAADNPLLSDFHQFRVDNYLALNAYYNFSVDGDTETLNEIVASINRANKTLKEISEQSGNLLTDKQVSDLTGNFNDFKKLMRQNITDMRKRGYPDLRLVSDMANEAKKLSDMSDELYTTIRESDETDDRVESARSAAVLMARMMSKYAARSTSSSYQTFQGADSGEALDAQAKELDKKLNHVVSGNVLPEVKSLMRDVSSKWGFIRKSYINFNENNVSFVIDRYSRGILEGLHKVIDTMLGKTPKADDSTDNG